MYNEEKNKAIATNLAHIDMCIPSKDREGRIPPGMQVAVACREALIASGMDENEAQYFVARMDIVVPIEADDANTEMAKVLGARICCEYYVMCCNAGFNDKAIAIMAAGLIFNIYDE